jgi:hypothetical protein
MINWNITLADSEIFYNAVDEVISQFGMPLKYIVATNKNLDKILGEFQHQNYTADGVYDVFGTFSDLNPFSQDQELYSKFGIQISDTLSIFISDKQFVELGISPNVNDLIFWGDYSILYEVTRIDKDVATSAKFMAGKPNALVWELSVNKYVYDNDTMQTGIEEIDNDMIQVTVDADDQKLVDIDDAIQTILDNTERSPWEI